MNLQKQKILKSRNAKAQFPHSYTKKIKCNAYKPRRSQSEVAHFNVEKQ